MEKSSLWLLPRGLSVGKLRLLGRWLTRLLSYYVGYPIGRPELVAIILAERCNLRCQMCDVWKVTENRPGYMMLVDYERLFRELARYGVKKVQFTGGETLMRRDLVDIARLAHGARLETRMVTNGTMITEQNAPALAECFDTIYISIDGPSEQLHDKIRGIPGTFEKCLRSIRCLAEARRQISSRLRIVITSVITPDGLHDPQEMVDVVKRSGADEVIYNPASNSGEGYAPLRSPFAEHPEVMDGYDGMTDQILALMRQKGNPIRSNPFFLEASKRFLRGDKSAFYFPCFTGAYDGPHIDVDGEVYPCCSWTVPMGNVVKESFREVWTSRKAAEIRAKIRKLQCPVCHHHTRTFDYIAWAPFLIRSPRKLIEGYRLLWKRLDLSG